MKWRRWVVALHRDLGYFFTGVIVLYAMSGIAVNHVDDWNPNFVIDRRDITLDLPREPHDGVEQATDDRIVIGHLAVDLHRARAAEGTNRAPQVFECFLVEDAGVAEQAGAAQLGHHDVRARRHRWLLGHRLAVISGLDSGRALHSSASHYR